MKDGLIVYLIVFLAILLADFVGWAIVRDTIYYVPFDRNSIISTLIIVCTAERCLQRKDNK